jgi:hypothetical protein
MHPPRTHHAHAILCMRATPCRCLRAAPRIVEPSAARGHGRGVAPRAVGPRKVVGDVLGGLHLVRVRLRARCRVGGRAGVRVRLGLAKGDDVLGGAPAGAERPRNSSWHRPERWKASESATLAEAGDRASVSDGPLSGTAAPPECGETQRASSGSSGSSRRRQGGEQPPHQADGSVSMPRMRRAAHSR